MNKNNSSVRVLSERARHVKKICGRHTLWMIYELAKFRPDLLAKFAVIL